MAIRSLRGPTGLMSRASGGMARDFTLASGIPLLRSLDSAGDGTRGEWTGGAMTFSTIEHRIIRGGQHSSTVGPIMRAVPG